MDWPLCVIYGGVATVVEELGMNQCTPPHARHTYPISHHTNGIKL